MEAKPYLWCKALATVLGFCLHGCGEDSAGSSSAPAISYQLERQATGQQRNALLFTVPDNTGYQFRLSGDGFTAEPGLDEYHAFVDRVDLGFAAEGTYSIGLDITAKNGTPYLSDTLTWAYSTEVPDPPIVAFTEAATNDTSVTMTIASSRKSITNEIWVEGDLAGSHSQGGFWDPLPDSNLYILTVTPQDGMKTMTVKLRNIYGNESEPVQASILKKSVGPTDCRAEMAGNGSASRLINLQLYATNNGPVFYNVVGDVDQVGDFVQFTSGDLATVKLSQGTGKKDITVKIRDLAGNYCGDIKRTVTLSGDYVTQTLAIQGNLLWTDDDAVDLILHYDYLPSDAPIEMKLTGDIYGPGVNSWIPYSPTFATTLMPGSGVKKVFAGFRDKDLNETFLVMQQVFAKPTMALQDAVLPAKEVIISKIKGMKDVTITGCQEAYDHVAYRAAYPCLPAQALVVVQFAFEDGTTLVKTAAP